MNMLEGREEGFFELPSNEGADKLCSLKDAVREMIRPGMRIHFTQTGARWTNAAIHEVARQFWDKDPGFTLVGISMNHPHSILVHGGLVKKMITSYCGEPYYTPRPNGVFQRAFRAGTVEFENWSILTLPLRLKAAAMGLPFITTKSLIGSSMEKDNAESLKVVEDPFGSGEKVAMIKALYPDVSFLHGLAADRYGNTLLCPPVAENTYGAMASKNGVIVTAERIVDTAFIIKHSNFNSLPGDYVKKVCHVPFGAHPAGMANVGFPELEGYSEDKAFVDEAGLASKDADRFDEWIKKWVLDCNSYEEYLNRVGKDKLLFLKGLAHPNSWEVDRYVFDSKPSNLYNSKERMLAFAGKEIQRRIRRAGHRTILAGAGMANLGAWLGADRLKKKKYDIELMAEVGMYGYNPRPFDPAVFNHNNFHTCKVVTDSHTILGIYASGSNNKCVGVIGFGQIDKHGNVNTTLIPGKTYIAGSGGANDIASSAREMIIIGTQDRNRFLDKIPYITSPGKNVSVLITDLGLYEKPSSESEFVLTGYFQNPEFGSKEEIVRNIKDNCGFDLKVAGDLKVLPEPEPGDIDLLRIWDPNGFFLETV